MLEAGWQESIREKNKTGNIEGAKKDLRMIRMSNFYSKLNTTDKLFVSYCIALIFHKETKKTLANQYLKEVGEILKDNDKRDYQVEYHNYLWLNVKLNHEDMDILDILRDMNNVYCFYKTTGKIEITMGALSAISVFTKDEETVLYTLRTILSSPITDYSFINGVLDDCKEINYELYIKGKEIINEYIKMKEVN